MTLLNELRNGKKKPGRPPRKYTDLTPHPLKAFFTELGITQVAVAARLGINPSIMSLYLSGRMAVPKDHEAALQGLADDLRTEMG